MTPAEATAWADKIDDRLSPISGLDRDRLAVFLRRVARNLTLALEDRARLDWLDRTPPLSQRTTGICQMAGEPVRLAIDRMMRAEQSMFAVCEELAGDAGLVRGGG
jgi:hypothetical protein